MRTKLVGLLASLALVGVLVGVVAVAGSAVTTTNLPLHNNTADPELEDCPDTVHDYWHFVVTPNSGAIVFERITLNLGTETKEFVGSQLIQNANQLDNVFVEVPAGFVVTDLVTSGSSADVSGGVTEQSLFNLGSVCVGTGFGSLAVTKVVAHQGANSVPSAFSATVECKIGATVTKTEALALASNGAAKTVSGIPAGSTCTVTETGVSPPVLISYSPISVVVNNDYVNVLGAAANFTG
jgi:Domain of unknown function (DUF5979)